MFVCKKARKICRYRQESENIAMLISLIVPCYNEEEAMPLFYKEVCKVAEQLNAQEIRPIKGDVFHFVPACREKFDFIFADPPYDLPRFAEVAPMVLQADLLNPGGIFVLEHSKHYDFSSLPGFDQQRVYGSVHFSFFLKPAEE